MLILHAAPHPDDEVLGAPATLMALRDAGHDIVNVACSLGDEPERADEVVESCRRAGFELVLAPETELARLCAHREPALVVGPSPHDRHPDHERVGRALLETGAERIWLWGLWGELRFPTTIVEYGEQRVEEILAALEAHQSQLRRNDYRRLVTGRGSAETVLAAERVFGFGKPGLAGPYAEATTEIVRDGSGWRLGAPRLLDPSAPFPEPTGPAVGRWLLEG
jgi:LmbE family N-acetylglucosaminyl deacetylase